MMNPHSCRKPVPIPSPGSVAQITGLRQAYLILVGGAVSS